MGWIKFTFAEEGGVPTLITDRRLEERLLAERRDSGADRYDEVWEDVTVMAPLPNSQHQKIVMRLGSVLQEVIGWLGAGEVFPGINLSDREANWERDYRVPYASG